MNQLGDLLVKFVEFAVGFAPVDLEQFGSQARAYRAQKLRDRFERRLQVGQVDEDDAVDSMKTWRSSSRCATLSAMLDLPMPGYP